MIFVYTYIIIDYINGKLEIHESKKPTLYLNSIVENEILMGVKNKRDLATSNKKISEFPMFNIDQDIMDIYRK